MSILLLVIIGILLAGFVIAIAIGKSDESSDEPSTPASPQQLPQELVKKLDYLYQNPRSPVPGAGGLPDSAYTKLKLIYKNNFSSSYQQYMKRHHYKDTDVYRRANISRQLFSQIKCGKKSPSRSTAIAMVIALKPNDSEFDVLLEKAGYSLSTSYNLTPDEIIYECLHFNVYDVKAVNILLKRYNFNTLN